MFRTPLHTLMSSNVFTVAECFSTSVMQGKNVPLHCASTSRFGGVIFFPSFCFGLLLSVRKKQHQRVLQGAGVCSNTILLLVRHAILTD